MKPALRFPTLALLAALVLAAAACGGGGTIATTTTTPGATTTTTPGATTVPPNEPARLVLQIADEGGFAPVQFLLNRIPRYSLYSDGKLYYEGPIDSVFPGPLLPNIQVADAGPEGIQDALEVVELIGLPDFIDEFNDEAAQFVADATSTVATYFDENGQHRYSVYALGISDFTDPRVGHLADLVNVLDTYAAESPPLGGYRSDRLQVLVATASGFDPQLAVVDPWEFDFDPTLLAPAILDFSCTVLEGAEADAAYPAFSQAHSQTFWEKDGTTYLLLPRPLLPAEQGCAFGQTD